jgi:hypothetical protein
LSSIFDILTLPDFDALVKEFLTIFDNGAKIGHNRGTALLRVGD